MQTLEAVNSKITATTSEIEATQTQLQKHIGEGDSEKEIFVRQRLNGLQTILQRYEGERASLEAEEAQKAAQQAKQARLQELADLVKDVEGAYKEALKADELLHKTISQNMTAHKTLGKNLDRFWLKARALSDSTIEGQKMAGVSLSAALKLSPQARALWEDLEGLIDPSAVLLGSLGGGNYTSTPVDIWHGREAAYDHHIKAMLKAIYERR